MIENEVCHRCGNKANYQLKNGKFTCSKHWTQCPGSKSEISRKAKEQYNKVERNYNKICDYGCGEYAKIKFDNGKYCCSKFINKCPGIVRNIKVGKDSPNYGKKQSKETIDKRRKSLSKALKGRKRSQESIRKRAPKVSLSVNKIKEKYPILYKMEEFRDNPHPVDVKGGMRIQVKCKNQNCRKWFTPSNGQFQDRVKSVEKKGNDWC